MVTIVTQPFCHPPKHQCLLEGSFHMHLVPQSLWLLPRGGLLTAWFWRLEEFEFLVSRGCNNQQGAHTPLCGPDFFQLMLGDITTQPTLEASGALCFQVLQDYNQWRKGFLNSYHPLLGLRRRLKTQKLGISVKEASQLIIMAIA